MRKIFLVVLTLVSAICVARDNSTSMTPIMDKAEKIVSYVENDLEMEIVRMEFDILRTKKTTFRTLSSDWTYTIIAFGDYRFKDIDIRVYRKVAGDWELEDKDVDNQSVAVARLKPQSDGDYKIEISAYSFEPGYEVGHYGLVIAH